MIGFSKFAPIVRRGLALAGFVILVPSAGALEVHYRSAWEAPRAEVEGTARARMTPEEDGWFRARVRGKEARIAFDDGAGATDPTGGARYEVAGNAAWIDDGVIYARRPGPGRIAHHAGIRSRDLENARDVWVYVPAGYDETISDRFPVVYLQDGNNMFSEDAPHGGWRAQETLDRLIALGEIPPLLAVAVSNTPDRIAEYTPTADPEHGGGNADRYLEFLIAQVKPLIDREYRTRADAQNTAVLGSSLGGLFAFHAAWTRPDVFGLAGAISPSLWWDGGALADQVSRHKGGIPRARFWLDSGDQGPGRDGLEATTRMAEALEETGCERGRDFFHHVDVGAAHNEVAWSRRLHLPLLFLFAMEPEVRALERVQTVIRLEVELDGDPEIALRGDAPGWEEWTRAVAARRTPRGAWVLQTSEIPAGRAFEFKALVDGDRWEEGPNHHAMGGEWVEARARFP